MKNRPHFSMSLKVANLFNANHAFKSPVPASPRGQEVDFQDPTQK